MDVSLCEGCASDQPDPDRDSEACDTLQACDDDAFASTSDHRSTTMSGALYRKIMHHTVGYSICLLTTCM